MLFTIQELKTNFDFLGLIYFIGLPRSLNAIVNYFVKNILELS